ncbi:MAG TPA: hypothetical protein DDZ90_06760, partial [Planctomycetaceae bacterium]|nr:hypothetical protein [Planctomycetaceae bacterium]
MGLIIGMDEAGYGPNLGPLVITASLWKLPDDPRQFDFWSALESVISQTRPRKNSKHLHVADSKQVHSASAGLAPLERSTLPFLQLHNRTERLASLGELWRLLIASPAHLDEIQGEPWSGERRFELPAVVDVETVEESQDCLQQALDSAGIELRGICSEIVLPARFNALCREYGSKGVMLTRLCMNLLTRVWDRETSEPTLIIGDKHGG